MLDMTQEQRKTYQRQYYLKNREKWRTWGAKQKEPEAKLKRNERRRRIYATSQAARDARRQRGKEFYWKYRNAIKQFLGGQCLRCGITDVRVLQVDHVNGDGWAERKVRFFGTNQKKAFEKIQREREKYQLLCSNCNWIKRFENQEFPKNRKLP